MQPLKKKKWKWKLIAQSCPTLCDLMDCSPPGSSVHGILQARILERVANSFSRGSCPCSLVNSGTWILSPWPESYTWVLLQFQTAQMPSTVEGKSVSHSVVSDFMTPWTVACQAPLSMGFSQARILEWVAIPFPFSRGSSQLRDQTWVSCIIGRFFTIWAMLLCIVMFMQRSNLLWKHFSRPMALECREE